MADELNTPTHRWYERRNNIALAKEDVSAEFIFNSGIQKINSWINNQPWGFDYPQLVLDFDNEYYRVDGGDTTFANAITHTRASTATYVDSTGTLQTAAINQPRLGHHVWNGSAWVNEGLLHESEARTNILEYSSELDNAYWAKAGSRTEVIANQITAPDGTLTADLVRAITGATTGEQYVRKAFDGLSGTYTTSAFVKKANWRYITIRAGGGIAIFDIDTARFTTLGGNVLSVQDFGDGWYRISASQTAVGVTDFPTIGIADSATTVVWSTAPANNEGVYVWGMQYEAAPTPSSYIPTAGSAVTRAADVLTVPAANLPYPEPVVIGPELVTNGDFSNGTTGFSAIGGATVSYSSGEDALEVNVTGTGGGFAETQSLTTEVGKVYLVSITVKKTTFSGNIHWNIDGVNYGSFTPTTDYQTFTQPFVATDASLDVSFPREGGPTGVYFVREVSVREINPLAVSIQMDGRVTYADNNSSLTATFLSWLKDSATRIQTRLDTDGLGTGGFVFIQEANDITEVLVSQVNTISPDILAPFNISSRHGSTFINGAVDGTALTADLTPVALPDLSTTDLVLGEKYNGTIRTFRVWAQDVTDAGLIEATT